MTKGQEIAKEFRKVCSTPSCLAAAIDAALTERTKACAEAYKTFTAAHHGFYAVEAVIAAILAVDANESQEKIYTLQAKLDLIQTELNELKKMHS